MDTGSEFQNNDEFIKKINTKVKIINIYIKIINFSIDIISKKMYYCHQGW